MHEDFDKEMAGSVVDTAAIHGLREEMELEFAIFKEQVHTHGSVNGELRLTIQKDLEIQKIVTLMLRFNVHCFCLYDLFCL